MSLCQPEAEVWAGGKTVTGLSTEVVKFLGVVHTYECSSSLIKGEVVEKMAPELSWRITEREFKKCTQEECAVLTVRYETLTSAKFIVAAIDEYSLALSSPNIVIECGKQVCTYEPTIETPIPIGSPTSSGFPLVEAKGYGLTLKEGGAGCEKNLKWDATYKLTGGALTVKFSLFKL